MNSKTLNAIALSSVLVCLTACNSTNTHINDNQAKGKAGISATVANNFMVLASRPNNVHLVDLSKNEVVRSCEVPGGPGPGTVVMSPDNTIAYVLADHFNDVYGINIDNCELVFSTQQSSGNIRVKSMGSVALSPDGKQLYTHQNRVKLMYDHYELLDTEVAVFDTTAGLNVKASASFEAPRQVTIMDVMDSGTLILGGPDIYSMNTETGDYELLLASRSHEDPKFAQRDVLTVWPLGRINEEFFRLYSTARFNGESGDMNDADFLWGYERVDLKTGETEAKEFGPLTGVLFTGARRPGHLDKVYGTLNHLKEFDIATQTELRSIDLEKTYYCINFSTDGSKIYLSGALDNIAVYDADTLTKLTNIQLTGDGSMANSVVFER